MPWDINDSNSNKHVFYHRVFSILRGRLGAEWLGCWTCGRGSNSGRCTDKCNSGQVVHARVPLSPSNITGTSQLTRCLAAGKDTIVLTSHWPRVTDIGSSRGLGEGDDHPPVFSSRVWWTLIFIPHSSATMCSRGDSFLECWGSFGQMPLLMTATAGEIWILLLRPLPPPPLAYFS